MIFYHAHQILDGSLYRIVETDGVRDLSRPRESDLKSDALHVNTKMLCQHNT